MIALIIVFREIIETLNNKDYYKNSNELNDCNQNCKDMNYDDGFLYNYECNCWRELVESSTIETE